VGTVGTTALLHGLVDLDVANEQAVHVQTLDLKIAGKRKVSSSYFLVFRVNLDVANEQAVHVQTLHLEIAGKRKFSSSFLGGLRYRV
jgi:hypothetical protein